jgi:hypothetical protein
MSENYPDLGVGMNAHTKHAETQTRNQAQRAKNLKQYKGAFTGSSAETLQAVGDTYSELWKKVTANQDYYTWQRCHSEVNELQIPRNTKLRKFVTTQREPGASGSHL